MPETVDPEACRGRKRGKQVRVARTPVGKGVFAQQTYKRGDIVGEIEGEVIDDVDYGSDYCFSLGETLRLEPAAPFRFVNHSCDPNCQFDYYDLPDDDGQAKRRRVFLLARFEIRPGEQLTIDYGWSFSGAIRCRCGELTCRGWIVSQADLPRVLSGLGPT